MVCQPGEGSLFVLEGIQSENQDNNNYNHNSNLWGQVGE